MVIGNKTGCRFITVDYSERFELSTASGNVALQIPAGMWHTLIAREPSVIFEVKVIGTRHGEKLYEALVTTIK